VTDLVTGWGERKDVTSPPGCERIAGVRWTQINERRIDDIVILDLAGETGHTDSDQHLAHRIQELTSAGQTKILLNLSDVRYIDSDGLASLVHAYAIARHYNTILKLGIQSRLV
jgi:anti-anti-sigma factor